MIYIGIGLMTIGTMLYLFAMIVNKYEILLKIGFLIVFLSMPVCLIGLIFNVIN